MDDIVFRDKYVGYNEISDVELKDINNVLLDNNILIDIGDGFICDWAAYSYYYCKLSNVLDEETISSFVYVIT